MRRNFRVRVDAPRPASAWAMVGVASATLWITQQLDWWAMLVQSLALLASLWRRTRPFAWQTGPVALNIGMFGIVGATIVVALRGEPSTIALAHFAALTQGLQLLDARPRRTEFLLVALALFQVILASNLTDSVFFTPLLIGFVVSTVWTLIVHTLHSEAAEAGSTRELGRAFTPGLVRTAVVASGLSVVLALLLFVTLPRLRSSVVTGGGLGASLATAGFSDTVAFGELGRIRQDPTVVMRVETLQGADLELAGAYWRGLAFDRFDGSAWSITPADRVLVPGSAEGGVTLGRNPGDFDLVQRIVREPVAAGVLFAAGEVRAIQGSVRRLERDRSGGLYAAGQDDERVRYIVRSASGARDERRLRADRSIAPRRNGERYLQLPPLGEEVGALARQIAGDLESDAERASALERHLLRRGQYTDTPAEPDPADPRMPAERFLLGDLAGHCEYFASAMVLLARELGIPARLVNGFAGGRENRIGGFVELTRSDAHAWVEIHYAEAGWIRYDPTPVDLRARDQPASSLAQQLRELSSALELWWFQRVVGFDRSDQIDAMKRAWLASMGERRRSDARSAQRRTGGGLEFDGSAPWREAVWLGVCLAGVTSAFWCVARRRAARPGLPVGYRKALRMLAQRGLVRGRETTARDFASEVGRSLPDTGTHAFQALTEGYLAARFGGRRMDDASESLRTLRESLREPSVSPSGAD